MGHSAKVLLLSAALNSFAGSASAAPDNDVYNFSMPDSFLTEYNAALAVYNAADEANNNADPADEDSWRASLDAVISAGDALDALDQRIFEMFFEQVDTLTADAPLAITFYSSGYDEGTEILDYVQDTRNILGIGFPILNVDMDVFRGIGDAFSAGAPSVQVSYTGHDPFVYFGDVNGDSIYSFIESSLSDLSVSDPTLELFVQ